MKNHVILVIFSAEEIFNRDPIERNFAKRILSQCIELMVKCMHIGTHLFFCRIPTVIDLMRLAIQ